MWTNVWDRVVAALLALLIERIRRPSKKKKKGLGFEFSLELKRSRASKQLKATILSGRNRDVSASSARRKLDIPPTRQRLSAQEENILLLACRGSILSFDEELALFSIYSSKSINSREAGDVIVEAHLPLVRGLGRTYFGANKPYVNLSDLVEAGCKGLLEALRRFNPQKECRFSTYAEWWVRKEMLEWIRRERWGTYIPDREYKALLKTVKAFKTLQDKLGRDPEVEEVAAEQRKPISAIRNLLLWATPEKASRDSRAGIVNSTEAEMLSMDLLLMSPGGHDRSRTDSAMLRSLESAVYRVLDTLSTPERKIIEMRFGLRGGREKTEEQVATKLRISVEEVKAIETIALGKLQAFLPIARIGS
jgi:RNA polymerase primary sigma factor